jgi:hypothetical protein
MNERTNKLKKDLIGKRKGEREKKRWEEDPITSRQGRMLNEGHAERTLSLST